MCTSIIVGKKAALNGKNIIARNEDFHLPVNPKRFEILKDGYRNEYVCENGLVIKLPLLDSFRTTLMPDVYGEGQYSELGINSVNVAVSSSESLYGNEKVLAYDPLVPKGIAEEAMVDILAPYMKSAKHGVMLLGEYIKEYGSAEGNGVLFADEDEIWYMEIPTGHHWVAIRIPEDSYAVAPNSVCIGEVDFDDEENFMYSDGIREFVEKYRLNPDKKGFNFRHIFGTYSKLDRVYNTARAWFMHRYLDDNFNMQPTDKDIPFINKIDRLISVEDVEYLLSSHYNETEYDTLGKGENSGKFRPISLSRTQESHVVEMGNLSVVWLAMGTTAFVPYLPIFPDVDDLPEAYRDTPEELDLDYAYWLFKVYAYYVETHYHLFRDANDKLLKDMISYGRKRVAEVEEKTAHLYGKELSRCLMKENQRTVDFVMETIRKEVNKFMTEALKESRLTFVMDKNL